jgi:hypothetical protein
VLLRAFLLLLALGAWGCHRAGGVAENEAGPLAAFVAPSVAPPTPGRGQKPMMRRLDSIGWVWPPFVGRFAFARRIALAQPDRLGNDRYDFGYPGHRALENADSLNTDGLEVIADYGRDVVYERPGKHPAALFPPRVTYPVYVVNSTPRNKVLYGKDRWVYAVQEAQDSTGRWRPIESKGPDYCGNGRWALKIRPGQMAVFLADKYAGDFVTRLRVRLQNGNTRYVSAPYWGRINEQQFRVPYWDRHALQKDLSAVDNLYFGAVPEVVDSIRMQ